jgi:hypothetical protein
MNLTLPILLLGLAVLTAATHAPAATPVTIAASTPLILQSPIDYQVVQRHTATEGRVRVQGRAPLNTQVLTVEIHERRHEIAFDPGTGTFQTNLPVPAGGWYLCRVEARGKDGLIATTEVPHVGVGEVFVVAGQSNSANHGEERLRTRTGRVAAFDGTRWQPANDPQPGASGEGGSFLPPFGDALADRFDVPIGLVACGIGATSVREWLPQGSRFPHPPTLTNRVRQLEDGTWESLGDAFNTFIRRAGQLGPQGFRAVLWHQGESDANQSDPTRTLPGPLYRAYLEQLIQSTRHALDWQAPWFVAQVSYHVPGDEASPDIRAAQASLWRDDIALEGPDSDALKGPLREAQGQGVHFSGPGLREHAARWVDMVAPWLDTQLQLQK